MGSPRFLSPSVCYKAKNRAREKSGAVHRVDEGEGQEREEREYGVAESQVQVSQSVSKSVSQSVSQSWMMDGWMDGWAGGRQVERGVHPSNQ